MGGYVPYYGYGYHGYYGKRSADAEADPALLYGAYGYGLPYAGYAYGAYPYAYGAYGVPFGHPSGQDPITQGLITKRSADADAAVLYGAYGYPYAYAGVPFGSSSGLDPITQGLDAATQGYVPYYGYGHHAYGHYYGKRSADAEAEAEAEPEAFYGHYGYPYGLGYNLGYAGYGYAGLPYTYGGIAATNAALGHAVAYTAGGVTHSSNVGVCTNYL